MSTSTLPRWAQTFIPTKAVKVTPVIISLNVLVWLIMIMTGVSPLLPEAETMRAWGATNTTDVAAGEYWRLLTSNYLHYGIIHIAANMLSLNNIGRMLEQFIGAWRFALLYTLTGICGSAASIWWHPYGYGAGASGAVLGIVGVLLALLTTNIIEKKARMSMLRSMAISAGIMILIGMQANVDNAAHLGGLLAGMIGGYFIYPELKAHYYEHKKQYLGLIASCLVIAGAIGWLVVNAQQTSAYSPPPLDANEFIANDRALRTDFINGKYASPGEIEEHFIKFYDTSLTRLEVIDPDELNEQAAELYRKLKMYMQTRKRYFEYEAKALGPDSAVYVDSARMWLLKSDSALNAVNSR
jgi:rhomboid protease GluP